MIYAAFDGQSREAIASDVFQYDTGEALELSGLPGELGGVTVEVHYGYEGDAKAEARIAQFDKRGGVWRADVPDVYLQRARAVNAYVYVIETELKKRTMYRVTFSPIERPAPSTEVTQAQADAWAQLVVEVNGAIAGADAAASRANAAAAGVTQEIAALNADKAEWEERLRKAEGEAKQAQTTAQDAMKQAEAAGEAANGAATAAAAGQTAADAAHDRADSAYSLASSANQKATNAHFWAVNGSIGVNGSGWNYNGTYDRYERNFAVGGMTAAMEPVITTTAAGAACPIVGAVSYNGGVTLYAADVPTVSTTITIKGIGVR